MCSGKIAAISLLVPHKTGAEFMCSGKIAVISVLVPHKTEGEFMCSGKIAVLSLLVATVVLTFKQRLYTERSLCLSDETILQRLWFLS
jgi:uncharacterized membrane protein